MSAYQLSTLADTHLLDQLTALVTADRQTTAALLAHLAEVDARELYLPAACSPMHGYCVRRLGFSEDVAFKRVFAARVARRFPAIFDAIADGRLHLSGVVLLGPRLTEGNAADLIAAAAYRSKVEIALLLAQRFPRPDAAPSLERVSPSPPSLAPDPAGGAASPSAPGAEPSPTTRTEPLAPERFALRVTIDQATHDKLVRAQALLRHRNPSGDLSAVIDRALDALLEDLERERFAGTRMPRGVAARSETDDRPSNPRHIPATVKRAVHTRDGEQCTFVSDDGRRCSERGFLELDHVDPVALGGQPTTDGIRILCRSHNQYEARRLLGPDVVAAARQRSELDADAYRALRAMKITAADARDALARSAQPPAETLEARIRAALVALQPTYASRPSRCSEARAPGWSLAFAGEDQQHRSRAAEWGRRAQRAPWG